MSSTVAEVLREAGLDQHESLIAAAIADGIAQVEQAMKVAPGAGIDAGARVLLSDAGLDFRDITPSEATAWRLDAAEEFARLASAALTVSEASTLLGVDESRIRQRLGAGSLYGFKTGRAWQIPSWQFEHGAELPGLSTVNLSNQEADPVAYTRAMTTPSDELQVDTFAVSPRQWLLSGRPPHAVVEVVASFATV